MKTLIGMSMPEFKVQAFHNGEFKTISHADLNGKWSVFFFYPADFTCGSMLLAIRAKSARQNGHPARLL